MDKVAEVTEKKEEAQELLPVCEFIAAGYRFLEKGELGFALVPVFAPTGMRTFLKEERPWVFAAKALKHMVVGGLYKIKADMERHSIVAASRRYVGPWEQDEVAIEAWKVESQAVKLEYDAARLEAQHRRAEGDDIAKLLLPVKRLYAKSIYKTAFELLLLKELRRPIREGER